MQPLTIVLIVTAIVIYLVSNLYTAHTTTLEEMKFDLQNSGGVFAAFADIALNGLAWILQGIRHFCK